MMQGYEKAYFMLFSAICDCEEALEAMLRSAALSDEAQSLLTVQIDKMKFAQQQTEELLISK